MFHPANGATLCYACHIRRVHREDSSYSLVQKIHDAVAVSAGYDNETMRQLVDQFSSPDPGLEYTEERYRDVLRQLSIRLGADPDEICATCARKYGTMVVAGPARGNARCGSCGTVTKTMRILPDYEGPNAQGGSHAGTQS